jgi:prophage tail gpP-like protein
VNNVVTLVVNGREYGGWKSVGITAGIERSARDFSLSITRSWPEAPSIQRAIQPFDSCEVYIGSDLVLTGDIDATPIGYDADGITVAVNGRSKTARLVDCSALNDPGQWSGFSVERIASVLAAVYGVTVKADVATGGIVSDHQIQQGETAFESIDRLLQLRQLLATDTARGELLITQASEQHSGETLLLGDGGNILTADASLDFKDVFSSYTCKGQRSSTETDDDDDENLPSSLSASSATVTDSKVPYPRPMIIKLGGQADAAACADRVRYERDYRRSKALATTYTVQGWRKRSGGLWVPNELVRVRDGIIGIDADWLIAEVDYSIAESGTICRMTVAPREGYVRPVEDVKRTKNKGRDSGDKWANVESLEDDPDEA